MMETLDLDKTTLGNLNLRILQNKFVLNVKSTGEGKTYAIWRAIKHFVVKHNQKMLIIMHQHENISDFIRDYGNKWNKVINEEQHIHFKGRDRKGMCYYEGNERIKSNIQCINCLYRGGCSYQKQWQVGFRKRRRIYFAVPQQIYKIYKLYAKKGIDVLFIDETISSLVFNSFPIKDELRVQILYDTKPIECPCESKLCDNNMKRLYSKIGHCGIFEPKSKLNTDFELDELNDYYLKFNLDNYSSEHLRIIQGKNSKGKITVEGIGEKSIHFIANIPTIVYNDAHAKIKEVEDYIGRKVDLLIKDEIPIKNQVWIMDKTMTDKSTEKSIQYLKLYLKFFKIPLTDKTFVVCKKKFLTKVKQQIGGNCYLTHYGNLTEASNKFKDCKNAVLFGRLEPKKQQKNALSDLGKDTKSIEEIGLRSELQALGRIRFFDDPSKKLYAFTNTVKKNIQSRISDKNNLHIILERELQVSLYLFNDRDRTEGLMKSELYKLYPISDNTIRPCFKKLLIPLKYCNNLYGKKGGKYLKWWSKGESTFAKEIDRILAPFEEYEIKPIDNFLDGLINKQHANLEEWEYKNA